MLRKEEVEQRPCNSSFNVDVETSIVINKNTFERWENLKREEKANDNDLLIKLMNRYKQFIKFITREVIVFKNCVDCFNLLNFYTASFS